MSYINLPTILIVDDNKPTKSKITIDKMNATTSLDRALTEALINPELVEISTLCQLLESALETIEERHKLKLAGDTISLLGQLYQQKAQIIFDSLNAKQIEAFKDKNNEEPIFTDEMLSGLLRHSLTLNLDDIVEQTPPKPSPIPPKTIAKQQLYKLIEEKTPDWDTSYEENYAQWQLSIDRYLQSLPANLEQISLLSIVKGTQLSISIVWLTLLQNNYLLEQQKEFYSSSGIVVRLKP
jgi:hypothetical protein